MGDKLMGARANPDAEASTKFLERLDLMERVMALEAREKVVRGNLKRGEEQLVRPRERYKGCRTVKLSTAKLALDHFEDKGPLVHNSGQAAPRNQTIMLPSTVTRTSRCGRRRTRTTTSSKNYMLKNNVNKYITSFTNVYFC